MTFINLWLLVIVLSLLSPATKAQVRRPTYIHHDCPNTTTFTINSTYQANRDTLLSSLSSNVTHRDGFYNTTSGKSPDIVYGLFLCRGDISTSLCQPCVTFAVTDITRLCPVETTAVVWYDQCLLRYSDKNIFSVVAETPSYSTYNAQNVSEPERFGLVVASTMNDTITQAANEPSGAKKFATREEIISGFQTLYALAQCTPELSGADCDRCQRGALANITTTRQGGRLLNPSCNVRYDLFPFYFLTPVTPLPTAPAPEEEKQKKSNRTPILVASLSAIFGLVVVFASAFLIWRKRNNQGETIKIKKTAKKFNYLT